MAVVVAEVEVEAEVVEVHTLCCKGFYLCKEVMEHTIPHRRL